MSSDKCFICDKDYSDGAVIVAKERAIETFCEASKKRNDGKRAALVGIKSITVHVSCQKRYINERMISSYLKKAAKPSTSFGKLRSFGDNEFSFKTHCFICGTCIPEGYSRSQQRLPPHERNMVHQVTKIEMKDTVMKQAEIRNDDFSKTIMNRIQPITDMVAADCQYHDRCLKNLYIRRPKVDVKKTVGPYAKEISGAMEEIFMFMENNDEECQFALDTLIAEIKSDFIPERKTIISHLLDRYGEDVIITKFKQDTFVCFKHTGHKILSDAWYNAKRSTEREERLRLVETAADIILEEIRSVVYETDEYPPPDSFLQKNEDLVPEVLKVFLERLILKKKRGDSSKWIKKVVAISHSIISAVRPSSFLSPLQLGLSVFFYKKFGSRKLIDIVSSLGFCASYSEAVRLEVSAITRPALQIDSTAFHQFVYDNADFNTRTLDGYNTFHAMGGIHLITPKSAIAPDQKIDRVKSILPAHEVGEMGAVSLKHFEKGNSHGLQDITTVDLSKLYTSKDNVKPSVVDLMWLFSKWKDVPDIPGWDGFMEQTTNNLPFQTTFVACLPFINAPPSDYNTIYTALLTSVEQCKSVNQQAIVNTFDQPLYLKARFIVACLQSDPNFDNVIIRIGGFHLLVSFLKTIGYIMDGSGLKELFSTIYALLSTEKILTGHAYSRAVRAHILAHACLAKLIFNTMDLTPDLQEELLELVRNADKSAMLSANENGSVKKLETMFSAQLQVLAHRDATSKLWIQYFEMVTLVKLFIEAERSANWNLHLQVIYQMLPYFHASGHFLYAKCSHLYLQDMHSLKDKMSPEEYEKFIGGGFTVRRTNKFWSGTWTDMSIEQSLMRVMKIAGGLTHGRGVSEGVLCRWTKGMTSLQNICEEMEKMCGVTLTSSEQHVEMREARIKRDGNDLKKLDDWFTQHKPFADVPHIFSLSTGVVGDSNINCHKAKEIGQIAINRIVGSDFQQVKFYRKDRVLPLSTMNNSLKIHDEIVPINPTTIVHRMTIAKQSDEELEGFLKHELCPYPMSLFDDFGMRKGTKSALYKAFTPTEQPNLEGCVYVIDGGYLLHKVVWSRGQSFSSICESYVSFVKSKFKDSSVVVFDGYSQDENCKGTKYVERARRSRKQVSVDLMIDKTMVPTVSQQNFLGNAKNKEQLISMLRDSFAEADITTKQAQEDADTLIVTTAIDLAQQHSCTVIVGEDVDLLVIMIGRCRGVHQNVFFLKPGKGTVSTHIFSEDCKLDQSIADNILFLHAMEGCDTTSALFKVGKIRFLQTLKKNPALTELISIFKDPMADSGSIIDAGHRFFISLYKTVDKEATSLDNLRYKCYLRSSYKTSANLASLPPTEAAAQQHTLRVYFQVQDWLGHKKDPEQWGWKKTKEGLVPIPTLLPPAPDAVLKLISCKCKKTCQTNCSCKKAGLSCSIICLNCESSCNNMPRLEVEEDDDDPELPAVNEGEKEPEGSSAAIMEPLAKKTRRN